MNATQCDVYSQAAQNFTCLHKICTHSCMQNNASVFCCDFDSIARVHRASAACAMTLCAEIFICKHDTLCRGCLFLDLCKDIFIFTL
jgi:hypothetical protein